MSIRCLVCEQRDAGHHYACQHCVRDTQRQLRELDTYVEVLALTGGPLKQGPAGRAPGYGSRPPARLDVATALDPRSGAGAAVHRLRDPRDMDDQPVRSIPGSLHGIACWFRDQHELTDPPTWTVRSEIAVIIGKVEWAANFDWVHELASDIRELWEQARRLAGDQPPGPLGTCLTVGCEGKVYPATIRTEHGPEEGARCAADHAREYTGTDFLRLLANQQTPRSAHGEAC